MWLQNLNSPERGNQAVAAAAAAVVGVIEAAAAAAAAAASETACYSGQTAEGIWGKKGGEKKNSDHLWKH